MTLAKELKVKTIAEFVENADILEAASALGIDYAQGYHIGHPSARMHVPYAPEEKQERLPI